MPDITNIEAIKFSNESIRPGANRLAHAYYAADAARDRWAALSGTTAQKKVVMAQDIKKAADLFRDAFKWTFDREAIWFLGINSLIGDTADVVVDNNGGPGPNTGAKVNAIIARFRQLNNYLRTGDFDSFAAGNYATLNKVLVVCSDGLIAVADADAQNFIDLCTAFANRYEASTNAELNTVLALAPNPSL